MKVTKIRNIMGLVLLSFLLCATDCNTGETRIFNVENKSKKPIKIKSFSSNILDNTFDLPIDGGVERVFTTDLGEVPRFSYVFSNLGNSVDSLIVIYDNTKIATFSIADDLNIRNPIDLDYSNSGRLEFTFTEEDYENAEECDGDCE